MEINSQDMLLMLGKQTMQIGVLESQLQQEQQKTKQQEAEIKNLRSSLEVEKSK